MGQHLLSKPDTGYLDPHNVSDDANESQHQIGEVIFTANGAGTTTTLVGATTLNGANAVRPDERGVICDENGDVVDDALVVKVTSVTTGASDTVTFSPALSVATASGYTLRLVQPVAYADNASLDDRLLELGFSQSYIDSLSQNDKVFQVRSSDDPTSL